MSFSDEEVAYLRSQRLARLATVSRDGQPDVVPVGYEFDGTHLYVGGIDPAKTRKFRNVQAGDSKVALVIDDLVSTDPWRPRYLRIYGTAELVDRRGRFGPALYMRITPTTSWSWNLDGRPFTYDRAVRPGAPSIKLWLRKAPSRFAPPCGTRMEVSDERVHRRGASIPVGRCRPRASGDRWFGRNAACGSDQLPLQPAPRHHRHRWP